MESQKLLQNNTKEEEASDDSYLIDLNVGNYYLLNNTVLYPDMSPTYSELILARLESCPYIYLVLGDELKELVLHPPENKNDILRYIACITSFITMCDFHQFTHPELEISAVVMIKALKYIYDNDFKIMQVVCKIISCRDKKTTVRDILPSKIVYVRRVTNFPKIIAIALKYLYWSQEGLESHDSNYEALTFTVLIFIATYIDYESDYSIHFARTLMILYQKHLKKFSQDAKNAFISYIMTSVIGVNYKTNRYSNRVVHEVLKSCPIDSVAHYMSIFINPTLFSYSTYIFIEGLLQNKQVKDWAQIKIGQWLYSGLSRYATVSITNRILKRFLPKIKFEDYNEAVFKFLRPYEAYLLEPFKSVFQRFKYASLFTLSLCFYKCNFIQFMKINMSKEQQSYILLEGVKNSYFSTLEISFLIDDLKIYFPCKRNCIIAICLFAKKNFELHEWHFKYILEFFLRSTIKEVHEVRRFLKMFVSHMAVQLALCNNPEVVKKCEDYLEIYHTFIEKNLTTGNGTEKWLIFFLTFVNVFVHKKLKLAYALTAKERETVFKLEKDLQIKGIFSMIVASAAITDFLKRKMHPDVILNFFIEIISQEISTDHHTKLFTAAFKIISVNDGNFAHIMNLFISRQFHLLSYVHPELFRDLFHTAVECFVLEFEMHHFPRHTLMELLFRLIVLSSDVCPEAYHVVFISMAANITVGINAVIDNWNCVPEIIGKPGEIIGSYVFENTEVIPAILFGFGFVRNVIDLTSSDLLVKRSVKLCNKIFESQSLRKAVKTGAMGLMRSCLEVIHPDEPNAAKTTKTKKAPLWSVEGWLEAYEDIYKRI